MLLKEKIADKPNDATKGQRSKYILLAALLFVCIAALTGFVVSRLIDDVRVVNRDREIAQLQQELDSEKGKNDALGNENNTLKGKVESLEKENDALKIAIAKQDGVFPAKAYEGKKLVALTFDDGPGKYTAELLDFLKQHRVRATFFVLGKNAAKHESLIKRMDAEGHAIGNHSYSHPNLTRLSAAGVASQIGRCNAVIYKATGRNPVMMRCPGGSSNVAVRRVVKNAGLPLAYWSVDTRDWESRDKDKIMAVAFNEKGIKDGSIVLMHDVYRETVDAAKEMVLRLEKEGYTFVTVPELLSVRKGGMQAGNSYNNGY